MIQHKDFEIVLDGSKLSNGSQLFHTQKLSRIIENDAEPSGIQNHTQAASRAFVVHKQILWRPTGSCEGSFAVFRYCYYSCLQFFDIVKDTLKFFDIANIFLQGSTRWVQ